MTFGSMGLGLLAQTPKEPSKPNVLLILADDLGWRDTSVYGSTFYQTPHIDALAASGMRFNNAYSANPLCSPTRASILTGQYPMRHGLTTAGGHVPKIHEHKEQFTSQPEIRGCGPSALNHLDPKHYTLGEAMKDAGYATGFFGKWHMGCEMKYWPENHGFDHVKGGRQHPGPPGTNPKRKFYPPWNCATLKPYPSEDVHVDDYITDLAIDYMKDQKANQKPFFVCYWAYSVHSPYQSKPELIEKWKKKVDPNNPQHSPTMGAMVEVLDDNIGRLMQALKDHQLDDNTIVIFTSDNGGNMYDTVDGTTPTNNHPLRSGKGNNYEGGVRIPLIIRWPGNTKPGSVSESVVSSVDHYPSLLEMTHQKLLPDQHKDGVSYLPALKGMKFDRGPILCDMPHPVWATYNVPNTFVRDGDWKMYRFWHDSGNDLKHRHELYNLRDDIGETKNLASKRPDLIKEMSNILETYYEETGALGYHPNKNFNKRTVGSWFATSDEGKISTKDNVLMLESDQPGYAVTTRFFPPGGRQGFLIFEARSAIKTPLKFNGPKKGKSVTTSETWQTIQLSGNDIFIDREKFLMQLETAGQVELKNVRVTTADKTEMVRYNFY